MAEKHLNRVKSYRQWIAENVLLAALLFSLSIHLVAVSVRMTSWDLSQGSVNDNELKLKIISRSSNSKQIVNTEDSKNKEIAEDAKFLGKKNQKFDRQTKSSNVAAFKKAGVGVRNGFNVQKYSKVTKKQQKRKEITKSNTKIKMKDLAMVKPVKEKVQKIKFAPSLASLGLENGSHTTSGLSASSAFVEDLPLGDMTNFNTTEYKYFGFYDRIRKKLERYWGNSLKSKARSMITRGVRLPATESKVTSLMITIDTLGNIVDVFIKSTSGIRELDDAAIESFNKAGPFPNPPKGMIVDGHAEIEWGFVVKG
ncbi:MAG: TonB family protein [Bacteriovoracaceae bacterium]|jgi:TonB family protein|nr:TonB family protein [Bacteriovoracaceae bacterium]